MKKVKYRLWALPISDETMEVANESEFSRIGDGRVLIYTDKPKKRVSPDAEEITDAISADVLTEPEEKWLMRCNLTICDRFVAKHKVPLEKSIPVFLKALEKELKDSLRGATDAEEAEHTE